MPLNTRSVWLDGAPSDVLTVKFRGGERQDLTPLAEDQADEPLFDDTEPLEAEDGRYWADLPKKERAAFEWKDVTQVRVVSRS